MSDVTWIKVSTDIASDEKMQLIESLPDGAALCWTWVKLITFAGKKNTGGTFMLTDKVPYTAEMLATVLHTKLETMRLALKTFEEFGMVDRLDSGAYHLTNWAKYQSEDKLAAIRENARLRQQKHRKGIEGPQQNESPLKNGKPCHVTVTLQGVTASRDVTPLDKDIEKDLEKEKDNTPTTVSPTADLSTASTREENGTRALEHKKAAPQHSESVEKEKQQEGNGFQGLRKKLGAAIQAFTADRALQVALWEWVVMRQKIHRPLSVSWLEHNLEELAALSKDPAKQLEIVQTGTEKQWVGFHALPEWENPEQHRRKPDPDCPKCHGQGYYLDKDGRTMVQCSCWK